MWMKIFHKIEIGIIIYLIKAEPKFTIPYQIVYIPYTMRCHESDYASIL